MSTAPSRTPAFNADNIYMVSQMAVADGSGQLPSIRITDHQNTRLNIVCPTKASRQSFGSYTRVMMIWRVVNSRSSRQLQVPYDGIRHVGTKTMRIPAVRAARVTAKSSLTACSQASRTRMRSNTSRRNAMEPPQAKFRECAPRAVTTDAFQIERNSEGSDPGSVMYQR